MSRFPTPPARLLLLAALSLAAAAACSEKPRKAPAKAKATTPPAAVAKVHTCPLTAGGAVTGKDVGGIVVGQDVKPLIQACGSVNVQGGQVNPALTFATAVMTMVAGHDSARVLAEEGGHVVEVDALTPGFHTEDSIRVGMTLGDVLQRRPGLGRDGGLEIRAGQLVSPPGGRCGAFVVFKDGLEGQQIDLSAAEIARQPRSLRVKRLAILAAPGC